MTTLQILKYLAVLLIGSSLALFIFFSINNRYLLQNKSAVDSAVTKSVIKLEDELNKINLVVESMAFFYENKRYIPQDLFERFTDPFIKELNGIKALAWAPKVEDSLRTKFEEYRTITQIDSSGQLVPTTSNNVHYPVTTLNPVVPFKQVLGYDVFSDSTKREAILRSIKTGKPAISGPIQLISEADGVGGILALKSVSSAISPENKGDRCSAP